MDKKVKDTQKQEEIKVGSKYRNNEIEIKAKMMVVSRVAQQGKPPFRILTYCT